MKLKDKIKIFEELGWKDPSKESLSQITYNVALEYYHKPTAISLLCSYHALHNIENKDDIYKFHIHKLEDIIRYMSRVEVHNYHPNSLRRDLILVAKEGGYKILKNRFGDNNQQLSTENISKFITKEYNLVDHKLKNETIKL